MINNGATITHQFNLLNDLAYLHYLLVTTPAKTPMEMFERINLAERLLVILHQPTWASANAMADWLRRGVAMRWWSFK